MNVTSKGPDSILDELVEKIKVIYTGLSSIHNAEGECEDSRWENDTKKWLDPLAVKSPEHWLITCICYGPWREGRQKQVWQQAAQRFEKDFGGDIRKITKDNVRALGFPFGWQREWLAKLSNYLRNRGMSFGELVKALPEGGLEARDELLKALGVKGKTSKILSVFVRDCLKRDVFPIDTRVQFLLSALVLPEDERALVEISRRAQIKPTVLNRMFYLHQGKHCQKSKSANCRVRSQCYRYALWSSCETR
jgi:hypothetical protein